MIEPIQVITTTDSDIEANKIAQALLDGKLAACVSIQGPMKSLYWWQGNLDQAMEWKLTIKTRADWFADVAQTIRANHSYDIPEILATPILEITDDYLGWLAQELGD